MRNVQLVTLSVVDHEVINTFYKANHSDMVEYDPGSGPNSFYLYKGLFDLDLGLLVGITGLEQLSPKLAKIHSTLIHKDYRGLGLGKQFTQLIEGELKRLQIHKVISEVYTTNLPQIIMKLKQGYLIEGLLRDNEEIGKHEYIMVKHL